MEKKICIGERWIGKNEPAFIIAEMSANHNMDYERAKKIIKGVKDAGADAVKLQTYTPDTIMIIFKLTKEHYGMEQHYISYIREHIHHGNGRLI